jgi:hypothetical protein
MSKAHGYKEEVTDDQVVNLIESGIMASSGDWLNSSDLSKERLKSTYEYAGIAQNHLAPQGVSTIVDTSTTEVVEAYIAVLSELFLNNGKLARFFPMDDTPGAYKQARDASMVTNYAIFKQNNGWETIQTWMKSALLWKNGIIRWDYVEDFHYTIEEYERVDQAKLDMLLADEAVEIVGDLEFENETVGMDAMGELMPGATGLIYTNVRLRRKEDRSRCKISNVPPENFRISRNAESIEDADFIGIQTEMTRSEIRKTWPDVADSIDNWDELGDDESWTAPFSEDVAARKMVTGQNYAYGANHDATLEANREVTVTECWIKVDRDGDGIAELKHFITVGNHILHENDVNSVPLASLSPIDIPFEFYGLSMADFTRSSTLASTAILRGFVENTYLTNYSPKLADPNVVDFAALQNMKPKQIIPTNGNPVGAVQALQPETISTGTVPLLQHLQIVKEQATGMSKAAQGLQDELFVSGNSEAKVSQIQTASQKRIQHIARRFAETGLKRLVKGVYSCMRECLQQHIKYVDGSTFRNVDVQSLPRNMECEIFLDLGENSNSNLITKYTQIGNSILPALNEQGAGMAVKTDAPAVLATKLIEAMGIDSNDFLEDYTTDEFKEKAAKAVEQQSQMAQEAKALDARKIEADAALAEANVAFTGAQTKNTSDDNAKQLAVAIDKHHQEWAELTIKAGKEGIQLPDRPGFDEILLLAKQILQSQEQQAPQQPAEQPQPQQPQEQII